ncbi:MAG: helix-turn-helix domain-containing protein [Corynebacterium sp.]|nr:helix-turn-helix domain-containing protein [Corynebacterium sp.]
MTMNPADKQTNPTRKKQGKPASDNPTLLALGELLAARRRERGLVQAAVAESAGVSRSTLHTIEHGGEGVRWEKVIAVADVLGLEVILQARG